jgi:MAF protein
MQIILGSSSIYRAELLKKLGLEFDTFSPNINEDRLENETAKQLVYRLAEQKAYEVAKHKQGLIIASDQACILGEDILGKPITHQNAVKQLSSCSGKKVEFLTSLSVLNTQSNKIETIIDSFSVYFKTLSLVQIESYLKKEQPLHCAGSFKSEGLGIALFEKLEGEDPNSLIGLPLIKLIVLLEKNGIFVLS